MTIRAATQSSKPHAGTLGAGGDWRGRLWFHHAPLAAASAAVFVVFMYLAPFTSFYPTGDIISGSFPQELPSDQLSPMDMGASTEGNPPIRQATDATGYVAVLLGALTLLIGPANLMLRKRNPVSSYLRRDLGAWTAIACAIHVVLGFQVHGTGEIINYFYADGSLRLNSFGLGNWTGLAALIIVAGLLALSTDGSIRELKAKRWKNLQRLNYALFALIVLHAFFYGALLRTESPFTLLLVGVVIAVLAAQAVGVWLWRRRHARAEDISAPRPAGASQ